MRVNRIIGRYTQEQNGPIFIGLAGVHGNELAGVYAISRVLRELKEQQPNFIGEFIGIAGNLEAIKQGKRFIDTDLNRLWDPERIKQTIETPKWKLKTNEERQQKDLLRLFSKVIEEAGDREIILIDMHTTSAFGGIPFAITNYKAASQSLALNLGIPVITGVEKVITGTTLNYFTKMELSAFGIEAGQHNEPESKDRTEAALWMSLVKSGCMDSKNVPDFEVKKNLLEKSSEKVPHLVDFTYRHHIKEGDEFEMKEGYSNFQKVEKGEELGKDQNGKILSPLDGLILMPLYQKQGQDGFFIAQIVEPPKEP